MKGKESPDFAFLSVAVIKHPNNSKRMGEALFELHPEDTHAYLQLNLLSPLWENRECCYPQGAGLPTSVNVIKRIHHRHAHRSILPRHFLIQTLSPGDSTLNQVDSEN